jgi:hypothetical protein
MLPTASVLLEMAEMAGKPAEKVLVVQMFITFSSAVWYLH